MAVKNLFWWKYKPADEREQVLFTQAYKRTSLALTESFSLFALLLLWKSDIVASYPWMEHAFDAPVVACAIFLILYVSYLFGGYILRQENLHLKLSGQSKIISIATLFFAAVGVIGLFIVLCQTFIQN